MAQEVNTLTTNNSAGTGFFGSLFSGLADVVTAAAPAAANIYQLQLQGDVLKNQSAGQLAALQLQQQQLAAANQQAAAAAVAKSPSTWMPYILGGGALLLLVLLVLRRRMR